MREDKAVEDRYGRNPDTLEEDLILAERARNEIPPDCLGYDWIAQLEEESRSTRDLFDKSFNIRYPFFKDSSDKKHFPHGGVFIAYPLTGKSHCFEFKRYGFREKRTKHRNEDKFFIFIVDGKTKYDEQLSFKQVLDRVQEEINNGKYIDGASFSDFEALSLQDDLDYLGKRASPAFLKRHSDRMDLIVTKALRSMQTFFQSRKPGIILLRKHFEKRYIQMFHGTLKEKKDAARFVDSVYKNRAAVKQSEIPETLYISGLVHFLLPIAWSMHRNYREAFPKETITINTPNWEKKIHPIDHRLIPLIKKDTLHILLGDPRKFIEQELLTDFLLSGNKPEQIESIRKLLERERKS